MTTPSSDQSPDLVGIVQVTIPVSDLALSAAWYRDLLGLDHVREIVSDGQVTGTALADWESRYFVAFRLRSTLAGPTDLRGEHPVILEAASPEAAERVRARAAARGLRSTSGVHADGSWTEYLDPDGIAVRVVHSLTTSPRFLGVEFRSDGEPDFYETPRLALR